MLGLYVVEISFFYLLHLDVFNTLELYYNIKSFTGYVVSNWDMDELNDH